MVAAVLEVRYQKRGDAFGIYSAAGGGWPELLEGGIATLEAAEARLLELERERAAGFRVVCQLGDRVSELTENGAVCIFSTKEAARAAAAKMRILMEGGARVVYTVKAGR